MKTKSSLGFSCCFFSLDVYRLSERNRSCTCYEKRWKRDEKLFHICLNIVPIWYSTFYKISDQITVKEVTDTIVKGKRWLKVLTNDLCKYLLWRIRNNRSMVGYTRTLFSNLELLIVIWYSTAVIAEPSWVLLCTKPLCSISLSRDLFSWINFPFFCVKYNVDA